MKLTIISTIEYPSTLANRIHLLEMTRAFAGVVDAVTLLCRSVRDVSFPANVGIKPLGKRRSLTTAWTYAHFLKKNKADVWFVREPHLLLFTIIFYVLTAFKLPPKIWYEIHDMPRDTLDGFTIRLLQVFKNVHIITITTALAADLQQKFGLADSQLLVLPDGVNLDTFTNLSDKTQALQDLGVHTTKPIVAYTGNLYAWKGVYTLLEAARSTPEIDYWFVGGNEADITALQEKAAGVENIRIWGHVPHAEVKKYLAAADILALPNSATYKMSQLYTSPLKLFEYMAAGKVIVASNLPSIREIITDGHNGYLVQPDDAAALATKIREITTSDSHTVATTAREDADRYSWKSRVARIIETL